MVNNIMIEFDFNFFQVAAIPGTFEYNLGVRRNAKMNITGLVFQLLLLYFCCRYVSLVR